ncbi:MAG: cysteine desulfurase [Deltaproteobacteria bacterium]|nr:cysteine desulfurase [Deltaproteobacteria bacterium]
MIYCDHNATTPLRQEVLEAMGPFLHDDFGNASSAHALGARARQAVEQARAHVARLIGAQPSEVVFTSGGTESNNLAILGVAAEVGRSTILSTPIEHASVREPVQALREHGYTVQMLGVDPVGRVDPSELETLLDGGPAALVSVGWANNEIGTIQPIDAIGPLCRARQVLVHVDAVQAAGKVPVHVRGADLLSLSAHKLGGPKGVGALYVRRGVALRPLMLGGGQERGWRPGTENVAGIVGMGEACRLAAAELTAFAAASRVLRDGLWFGIEDAIPDVRRNGPGEMDCLPNTLNVSFEGIRGEALVAALDLEGVAVSSGSACAAGAGEPSHVLLALGRGRMAARDGVRFSLGRTSTAHEIEQVVHTTIAVVQRMRAAKGRDLRHE